MANIDDKQKVFGFVLPAGVDGELIKQSILTYLGVALIVTVFLFFVLPRLADLGAVALTVAGLQKNEESLKANLGALDAFKTQVDSDARNLVYLAIPARFDPGLILLSLRKLTADNHVNLISYSLGGGQVSGGVEKATNDLADHKVNISISGPAANLVNFVDGLDKYLPIVTVTNLSLSEVSKLLTQTSADLKLELELNYYHLPLVADPSAVLSSKPLQKKDLDLIQSLSGYTHLTAIPASAGSGTGRTRLFEF